MRFLAEKRCVGHNKTEFHGYKKRSPPRGLPQGAVSHKRPVSTGRDGESERLPERPCRDVARAVSRKNEEAPCLLGRGPRESSSDLLSRARGPGTIGDEGLDFRVRKGNGYDPLSVTAETNSMATRCRKSLLHSLEADVDPGCPRGR